MSTNRAAKRQLAEMDRQIERAYYRLAGGVQIDIMDIGKIFAAGRAAILSGADLDTAITEIVTRLRKN